MTDKPKVLAWAVVDSQGQPAWVGLGPSNWPGVRQIPLADATQMETLMADALRYRWLRDPANDLPAMFLQHGDKLDAAIDSAMAAKEGV